MHVPQRISQAFDNIILKSPRSSKFYFYFANYYLVSFYCFLERQTVTIKIKFSKIKIKIKNKRANCYWKFWIIDCRAARVFNKNDNARIRDFRAVIFDAVHQRRTEILHTDAQNLTHRNGEVITFADLAKRRGKRVLKNDSTWHIIIII